MLHRVWKTLAYSVLMLPSALALAQAPIPLPPETQLVALPSAPAATLETFTIAAPGQDLIVTLTDLQVPAALSSASVSVTQGMGLIGFSNLAPPATSATLAIPAATGQFTLRVIGAPGAGYSFGTFTVCVAPKSDPANCIQDASITGNVSTPGTAADPTVSTLSATLSVTNPGTYTVNFADDAFPAALNTAPNLALFQGSQPIALGIASGTAVTLNAGTYTLLSIAQADQTTKAGVYGITISGPTGAAALFDDSIGVGQINSPSQIANSAAQTLTLTVADFAFPSALSGAQALATAGGTVLGTASAANPPAAFAAPSAPLKVWTFATANSDAGTYGVTLASADGTALLSTAHAVSGSTLAYAFVTSSLSAGTYQASVTDFNIPASLQGLKFAVGQNNTVLQTSPTLGSVSFTAAAGPVIVLVDAVPPSSGNGLIDVNIQTTGSTPQLLYDTTQGVGINDLFQTRVINYGASGDFTVSLSDLRYPAAFDSLALVVSSGGKVLGQIYGGGNFPIPATAGAYQLTFIATPSAQQLYGLYGVQIAYSAPTVQLSAAPTSVVTNSTTTLTWTSTDATACTASGGWSGAQAVSGSLALTVPADATYTLTCTGPGGSAAQSVSVTVTAVSGKSGGGAFDWYSLLGLLLLAATRGRRCPRPMSQKVL